ncbi:uncharacterized protein A4U43_C08F10900 [Asparagus officinalis]|nr:uncharacterized protein A4U43_C08F10900 [Asparagus officinalis]
MESTASFSDFPDDVQLAVLSLLHTRTRSEPDRGSPPSPAFPPFLRPLQPQIPNLLLLYLSMCRRRWGSKNPNSRLDLRLPSLYRTLDRWAPLIGFWRPDWELQEHPGAAARPLRMGPSSINASRFPPRASPGATAS